jgi:hypothetical protein
MNDSDFNHFILKLESLNSRCCDDVMLDAEFVTSLAN